MLKQRNGNAVDFVLLVFGFVALVVLFQLGKGFINTTRLLMLAREKNKELVYSYARAASLKNQLDRITQEAFREEFLKRNLDYYEQGEMLVILEGTPQKYVTLVPSQSTKRSPIEEWLILFSQGRFALLQGSSNN